MIKEGFSEAEGDVAAGEELKGDVGTLEDSARQRKKKTVWGATGQQGAGCEGRQESEGKEGGWCEILRDPEAQCLQPPLQRSSQICGGVFPPYWNKVLSKTRLHVGLLFFRLTTLTLIPSPSPISLGSTSPFTKL